MISRRGFLGKLVAVLAVPAGIRAFSLWPKVSASSRATNSLPVVVVDKPTGISMRFVNEYDAQVDRFPSHIDAYFCRADETWFETAEAQAQLSRIAQEMADRIDADILCSYQDRYVSGLRHHALGHSFAHRQMTFEEFSAQYIKPAVRSAGQRLYVTRITS